MLPWLRGYITPSGGFRANGEVLTAWTLTNVLEVSIFVFAVGLQNDGDDGHERFDHTELQSSLLTEAQEADGVGPSFQTARPVHAAGPGGHWKSAPEPMTHRQKTQLAVARPKDRSRDLLDGLPPDLCHDGALPAQVFVAQTQEAVNNKG